MNLMSTAVIQSSLFCLKIGGFSLSCGSLILSADFSKFSNLYFR